LHQCGATASTHVTAEGKNNANRSQRNHQSAASSHRALETVHSLTQQQHPWQQLPSSSLVLEHVPDSDMNQALYVIFYHLMQLRVIWNVDSAGHSDAELVTRMERFRHLTGPQLRETRMKHAFCSVNNNLYQSDEQRVTGRLPNCMLVSRHHDTSFWASFLTRLGCRSTRTQIVNVKYKS
jgi:hypothetical protein